MITSSNFRSYSVIKKKVYLDFVTM